MHGQVSLATSLVEEVGGGGSGAWSGRGGQGVNTGLGALGAGIVKQFGGRFWGFWAFFLVGGAGAEELPPKVDLSSSIFFPPVILQEGQSCAQEVGLSTMMTYEWNRLRGTEAVRPENRFAGRFLWHFLNRGENRGAELSEGWILAQEMGVLPEPSYGGIESSLGAWPSGYALYHEAMKYRVRGFQFIAVDTVEGLQRAKRWLHQRGEERRSPGGLLAIEGRLKGFEQVTIPEGQVGEGRQLVVKWGRGTEAGHLMTYAGYDDGVGHDVNGDGRITNDVDLNGDGELTLADWERGAFIAVNSYGTDWGDAGQTYVLYREAAVTPFRRGHWAAAMAVWPQAITPRLTVRLVLEASCQSALRVRLHSERAGGQRVTHAPVLFDGGPRREVSVPPGSPEGYNRFLTGQRRLSLGSLREGTRSESLPVELGLDLTGKLPLAAEFYELEGYLDEGDPVPGGPEGIIHEVYLRRYDGNGQLEKEWPFSGAPLRLDSERQTLRLHLD